jgi:hypothetical protein
MIISVIFVLLFLAFLMGIILVPKIDGKINMIKVAVMGIMAIFCYQSFWAFMFQLVGIPVNLKSTCISMAAVVLLLWGMIIKKKKMQRIFVRITDIAVLAVLAGIVIAVSLHMFTPYLRLSYINSDPANHFNDAMGIVKQGVLGKHIYFSAFVNAMFIEIFSPILIVSKYYKAFIFADIFMHVLEVWMCYVLMLTVSEKKIVRIFAPVFALGYFWGYPAYSYMTGGFVYWSIGVMILMLLVYALLLLERYPKNYKCNVILLLFALYANTCCNALFIPLNSAAVILALFVLAIRQKKINKKMIAGFLVVVVIAAAAVFVLFMDKWGGSFDKMITYVSKAGGMYHSVYADLIYFIPAAFIVLFYLLKKKKYPAAIPVMALFMVVCTCVMYGFLINHMMSFYYYFKIYYNLWLFGWLLCVMAADILADEKQLAGFYAYVGFIGILALFTFTNYDMNMWEFDPGYNEASVPKHFLAIYWNNLDTSQKDYGEYTILPDLMEVMSYAAEELDDDKIPALVADDRTFYWFDGMRAQNTRKYKPYNRELMDILVKMDKNGITKIFVDKEDKIYQQYENYFSLCKAVYENERAAILTFPGESWCKILPYVNGYDEGKLELYKYVKKHLKNERVPLMAAKESCLDFIIYRQKTKQKSTDCYTWNFNPKENLDNLNQLGIKYITVLYGDSYYQENQYYLDGQETVFENESGKIIKCAGDSFSTEYK